MRKFMPRADCHPVGNGVVYAVVYADRMVENIKVKNTVNWKSPKKHTRQKRQSKRVKYYASYLLARVSGQRF